MYNSSSSPSVNKQYLPLNKFFENNTVVQMGQLTLSQSQCIGSLNGIDINVNFVLNQRHMDFVPGWIENDTYG